MQHVGHDKQPVGATGKVVDNLGQDHYRFKELEAAMSDLGQSQWRFLQQLIRCHVGKSGDMALD